MEGTRCINIPAMKQKLIDTVAEILMLSGRRSHANDIKPMIANRNPRKARKTQREWHRANSTVGGLRLKGPTCTKCGLVDQIGLSANSDWTRMGFVVRRPLA